MSMDIDISLDIHIKSVWLMDMLMDVKFHIHGNPAVLGFPPS